MMHPWSILASQGFRSPRNQGGWLLRNNIPSWHLWPLTSNLCMHVHACTNINILIHVYIYTYTCTYMNIHPHTHRQHNIFTVMLKPQSPPKRWGSLPWMCDTVTESGSLAADWVRVLKILMPLYTSGNSCYQKKSSLETEVQDGPDECCKWNHLSSQKTLGVHHPVVWVLIPALCVRRPRASQNRVQINAGHQQKQCH